MRPSRRSWASSAAARPPGCPGPAPGSPPCAASTTSPPARPRPRMSHQPARMPSWSPSPGPRKCWASAGSPSTGGCATGSSPASRSPPGAPWQIRIDQALRDKIRPEVPDGWLSLDAAAKALGIARQTVLHKVQRGELQAVHVNRGRRKGLRIQVKQQNAGLFDTPDKEKGAVLTMTGGASEDQVLPRRARFRDLAAIPALEAGNDHVPGPHGSSPEAAAVRTRSPAVKIRRISPTVNLRRNSPL